MAQLSFKHSSDSRHRQTMGAGAHRTVQSDEASKHADDDYWTACLVATSITAFANKQGVALSGHVTIAQLQQRTFCHFLPTSWPRVKPLTSKTKSFSVTLNLLLHYGNMFSETWCLRHSRRVPRPRFPLRRKNFGGSVHVRQIQRYKYLHEF